MSWWRAHHHLVFEALLEKRQSKPSPSPPSPPSTILLFTAQSIDRWVNSERYTFVVF